MQITRQADYAVRAVLCLAKHGPSERVTTAQIGREQHIPQTFLAKIMARLSVAGIVHSTRGSHGGMSLARPADEISLLDIVEAIDGPMRLNECVSDPGACPLAQDCSVQAVWRQAQAELVDRLARTNFSQLASPHVQSEALFEPA